MNQNSGSAKNYLYSIISSVTVTLYETRSEYQLRATTNLLKHSQRSKTFHSEQRAGR